MKVSIKDFSINMDVKTSGIEFQVRETNGTLLGDCYLTKKGLIWCKGQTTRQNGKMVTWKKFIKWMDEQ
jgi:hypothetical protein